MRCSSIISKIAGVPKHLKAAGFKKKFGFTCTYLFCLVFTLLFHQKNWFRLLEGKKSESFPGKDAVYRFLKALRH